MGWQTNEAIARAQRRAGVEQSVAADQAAAHHRCTRRRRRYWIWPLLAVVVAPFVLVGMAELLAIPQREGDRAYFVVFFWLLSPLAGAAAAFVCNAVGAFRDVMGQVREPNG